jgi:ParB family chromosome partitioning protein
MPTKLQTPTTAGFNAIGKNQFKMVSVDEIIIDPEISSIFKIDEKLLEQITQSIIKDGYDESQPVTRDKATGKLLDGHTRLQAAKNAGLAKIPVVDKEFDNPDELFLYTLVRQSKRRNLKSAEILEVAKLFLNTKKAANGNGRTLDAYAELLGIGSQTLSRAKTVLKEGTPDIIEAVRTGKMSTKEAFKKTRKNKNPDNRQEVKNIEIDTHGHSGTVPFLKAAVILLVEKEQSAAAQLLVNHFLRKNEKKGFYDVLPEAIRGRIQLVYPVH